MPHEQSLVKGLENKARTIRKVAITMIKNAGMGWPGGSLSQADILTALMFHHMSHNPENPAWEDRDRLILSKGHCCETLYSCLGEAGYFAKEEYDTYARFGGRLQAHVDHWTTPGIEYSSGSLGEGLSFAVGLALAAKIEKRSCRVFCIVGDGECDEGQVWEAALSASHLGLDNLVAIIDRNKYQSSGPTDQILDTEPFVDKWRSFRWHSIEIDGNDMIQILDALDEAMQVRGKPHAIIAHTLKGKGVPLFEQKHLHMIGLGLHPVAFTDEMFSEAVKSLR